MSIKFSVAIPAYNCASFLAETLDSVLGQTFPPDEIIVVNDGSSDATDEIIASYSNSVLSINTDNSGPGAARKLAVETCTNEWIALCDSDDIWQPEHLNRVSKIVERNPDLNIIFTNFTSFGPGSSEDHTLLLEAPTGWIDSQCKTNSDDYFYLPTPYLALLYFNIAYTTGTVFTRSIYQSAGGIDPYFSRWLAEHAEFMRRLVSHPTAKAAFDPAIHWSYRRHHENFSTPSEFKNIIAGNRILEEHLRRKIVPNEYIPTVIDTLENRRIHAFRRAYWEKCDDKALEISKTIPWSKKSVRTMLQGLHSRIRLFASILKNGEPN